MPRRRDRRDAAERFDRSYYDRYYRDPATRVYDRAHVGRLGAFVCHYLRHLGVDTRRVVDLGCGLGFWRAVVAEHFPRARYVGVEVSDYLCSRYGWVQASAAEFRSRTPFDLVVCQGVLQYLDDGDAATAIANLARLSRAALYLEALTREDWRDHCDRTRTDGDVHLRSADWYRRRLRRHFVACGGGVYVRRDAGVALYELERGAR